ncbi:MAG: LarC family nickel insertion protein, partial [Clostridiales bacterium]|nr:LarC family nickel insertion protein [Clostridiales bacterium]
MKIAYFDCAAGISGDMSLAALIDAGAEAEKIKGLLARLPLPGWRLETRETEKQHLRALQVSVAFPHEHAHRGLSEIGKIIAAAGLPAKVEANAQAVFARLAQAEAKIHGCALEEVRFHEVGAVDAIIDIVGSCAALHLLGVEKVFCSPL